MDALAREHLDHEWTPNEVVKVLPLTKKYTFELGCKLLLGVVDPEHIKRLADCFGPAVNGMLSVPIDFPGTNYNRAIKAGKTMREELIRIIRERRKEMMMENKEIEGRDLLSKMLLLTDEDVHSFSDLEIFINIFGLLVASFDTTSSTVTSIFWTVHSSHKNPKYFREPEKFDPSRFDESGPAPYTFVPFGGGPGMCPGKEYAKLEILVFMHNVVTRFKLEKTIPDEKIVYYTSAMPECGLPVRLQPHGK
ncbi:hypothetical protein BUALT_Bualt09G0050800 [Buddleja alternifolia]|uniref:Cytochrome P450 n=1 Tax=Buddleja alternifolia TaxID=168488 RepID=A0AAV6X1B2_9LAMI|nr:hypothetical protein BUALT_Bualt09G0050800 [Buddleja alternifolia]